MFRPSGALPFWASVIPWLTLWERQSQILVAPLGAEPGRSIRINRFAPPGLIGYFNSVSSRHGLQIFCRSAAGRPTQRRSWRDHDAKYVTCQIVAPGVMVRGQRIAAERHKICSPRRQPWVTVAIKNAALEGRNNQPR
jgi:hypothetical protein